MKVIHISIGGPIRTILIRKKTWTFEMHRYCGPMLVDAKGNGLKRDPIYVLEEISKWAQQGEKVDSLNRCVYDPNVPLNNLP